MYFKLLESQEEFDKYYFNMNTPSETNVISINTHFDRILHQMSFRH